MLDIDQGDASEHVDAIAERLATMLGLLQAQFKVAPDVIAMTAAAVIVEDGGMSALDALALGAQAGLTRYEMGREAEQRQRKTSRKKPYNGIRPPSF